MEERTTTTGATSTDDVFFKFLGWAHANRKPLIIGVVVVAAVGTAMGLYNWKQGQNDTDANTKLLAMPITPDLRIHSSDGGLANLAAEYPSTSAGEYALLLHAENLFVGGDYAQAQQNFAKFQSQYPASPLVAQAGMGIAASLEAQNKLSEATQQYEKVVQDNSTDPAIVEPAKLTLGRLAEEQKRYDLAFMQYRELAQAPAQSDPWAQEARQRLQLLVGNHPELLKSITAPTVSPTPSAATGPALRPSSGPTLSASPAAPTLSASPAGQKSSAASGSNALHFELQPPPAAGKH
jgi:predicted negative regulator of RcsB-dependent stress response